MNFTMHSKLVHVSYSDVVGQQLSVVGQHLVSSEIVQWFDGNCSVLVGAFSSSQCPRTSVLVKIEKCV